MTLVLGGYFIGRKIWDIYGPKDGKILDEQTRQSIYEKGWKLKYSTQSDNI